MVDPGCDGAAKEVCAWLPTATNCRGLALAEASVRLNVSGLTGTHQTPSKGSVEPSMNHLLKGPTEFVSVERRFEPQVVMGYLDTTTPPVSSNSHVPYRSGERHLSLHHNTRHCYR